MEMFNSGKLAGTAETIPKGHRAAAVRNQKKKKPIVRVSVISPVLLSPG